MEFKVLTVSGYTDSIELGTIEADTQSEAYELMNESSNNMGDLDILLNLEQFASLKRCLK